MGIGVYSVAVSPLTNTRNRTHTEMMKNKTRLVNSSGFKANQVNRAQHGRLYNFLQQQPLNLLSVSAFGGRFRAVVFQLGYFDHVPDPDNGLSGEKKPCLLQSEIGDTHILAVVFDEVLGTTLPKLPQLGVISRNIPAAVNAPDLPFVVCRWLKTVRRLGGQIRLMLLLVHRCFSL